MQVVPLFFLGMVGDSTQIEPDAKDYGELEDR